MSQPFDTCDHESLHVETVEVTYWSTPDIDSSYDVEVYVCDNCGEEIDRDIADPAEDRAEAEVDRQIDEARGN